jgi:ABC-2 type transport system ATP-binding protein
MTDRETALQVEDIKKTFAETQAVRGLTFEVHYGEIFGLLGPNGAGKTTSIRMILDIIKPTSGAISVLGGPMTEAKKSRIGYLPEERGLYDDMTVWDTLLFLGQIKGLTHQTARARAEEYLREVDLWDQRDLKVEAMSRGMGQKVQFVAATMHEPELLIVDEPFSGLDPVNTRIIKNLIYRMRDQGTAIIMSTHQMHQVEEMCGRILLINHGERLLYGRLSDIRQQFAGNTVEVLLDGEVAHVPGVQNITQENGLYHMVLAEGEEPGSVLERLVQMPHVTVKRFEQTEASLDDIFVKIVGEDGEEAAR